MSMQREYTQAFLTLIARGVSVDDALRGLRAVLAAKHHEKLLSVILNESLRTLTAGTAANVVHISVASTATLDAAAQSIKVAREALGADASVAQVTEIDETLIGGFVATFNHQEYDQSYKRVLQSLYESITV